MDSVYNFVKNFMTSAYLLNFWVYIQLILWHVLAHVYTYEICERNQHTDTEAQNATFRVTHNTEEWGG